MTNQRPPQPRLSRLEVAALATALIIGCIHGVAMVIKDGCDQMLEQPVGESNLWCKVAAIASEVKWRVSL